MPYADDYILNLPKDFEEALIKIIEDWKEDLDETLEVTLETRDLLTDLAIRQQKHKYKIVQQRNIKNVCNIVRRFIF
jgi:hypothetical protein